MNKIPYSNLFATDFVVLLSENELASRLKQGFLACRRIW